MKQSFPEGSQASGTGAQRGLGPWVSNKGRLEGPSKWQSWLSHEREAEGEQLTSAVFQNCLGIRTVWKPCFFPYHGVSALEKAEARMPQRGHTIPSGCGLLTYFPGL